MRLTGFPETSVSNNLRCRNIPEEWRSNFVYYYIINSVSTNYMEESRSSTAKLLNPTINYLPFKEPEDLSLCSKKVDRWTSPESLQFTSHTLFIYSLSQYYTLTNAQICRAFKFSSQKPICISQLLYACHTIFVFITVTTYGEKYKL